MSLRRAYDWDGGRAPEVSRMWARRQMADLDIRELAAEAGITARAWWDVESGAFTASPPLLERMINIVDRRYVAAIKEQE